MALGHRKRRESGSWWSDSLDLPGPFEYIALMSSGTVETRAHSTKDGRLNLSVDVELLDADVAVVVTVTPVATESSVDWES